jgi:hypothetical protein
VALVRVTGIESRRAEAVARFSATLDQPSVRDEIHRLVESLWSAPVSGEMSLHVLKAHRRRCTFEVAVETSDGVRRLIGKVYDVDRPDVFAAMQSIVRSGFGPTAEFAIPVPLGYLSPAYVLLEEQVPGIQAKGIFIDGDRKSQIAAAQRSGSWLARFHMDAPRLGNVETPEGFVEQLRHWTQEIRGAGGVLAKKAKSLLRVLEDAVPGPDGPEFRIGHGSYMPEHVLLSDDRVVTIDFDDCLVADPAHDIAWFLVSLGRLGLKNRGSLRVHDRSAEAFLQSYVVSGPRDAVAHLPFYRAAECLHRAYLDLSKRMPEWSAIMLEEGQRVLA